MPQPLQQTKNTWYCSTCKFYVFNSKNQCNKCHAAKPSQQSQPVHTSTSYDPEFDASIRDFYREQYRESTPSCQRCIREGRLRNCDPLKSQHDCDQHS